MTPARPLAITFALAAGALCAGCPSSSEPGPGADESAAEQAAAEAPEAEADDDVDSLACALDRATPLIESLRFESADGSCRLFLPHALQPGTYAVRVSAMSADQAAALEVSTEAGTLYATRGTVTVLSVEGGVVRGTVRAEDDTEPVVGRVAAAFEVALPATE